MYDFNTTRIIQKQQCWLLSLLFIWTTTQCYIIIQNLNKYVQNPSCSFMQMTLWPWPLNTRAVSPYSMAHERTVISELPVYKILLLIFFTRSQHDCNTDTWCTVNPELLMLCPNFAQERSPYCTANSQQLIWIKSCCSSLGDQLGNELITSVQGSYLIGPSQGFEENIIRYDRPVAKNTTCNPIN